MRRKASKVVALKTARKKLYEIDGKVYNAKKLYDLHVELAGLVKQKLVKSFELPQVGESSKSKYHNIKPIIDGIKFDSVDEARYYLVVLGMQKDKQIKSFELQHKFELLPAFTDFSGKKQRKMEYVADFVLHCADGHTRVIDVKGVETEGFKLKRKLFNSIYRETAILETVRFVAGQWMYDEDYKNYRKAKKAVKKEAA